MFNRQKAPRAKKNKILMRLLFLMCIYLFVEGLSSLGLLILAKAFRTTYTPNISTLSDRQAKSIRKFLDRIKKGSPSGQHPVLGWTNSSDANSARMRDDLEYAIEPPPDVIRIAAFGDSFTFGADVALEDSWAKQLPAIDPSLQVLNYGVGAYGLDQAYLRYLEVGDDYNPHIVFIGYMSENLARCVNVFRPFYSRKYDSNIFAKPRFTVKDDELVLIPNPLPEPADYENFLRHDTETLARLGENDHHYQTNYHRGPLDFLPSVRLLKMVWFRVRNRVKDPIFELDGMYNRESSAYELALKIFDSFYRKAIDNGALPIIVIFPDLTDQWRSRNQKPCRYTPLMDDLRSKGYRYIDTLEALKPIEKVHTIDDLVENWGHYSPLGNRIMALYLEESLRDLQMTSVNEIKKLLTEDKRRFGEVFP